MAIQSSWLLCERLVRERDALRRGSAEVAVAHAYARDWRRSFAARVRFAAVLAHLAMRPRRFGALLPLLRAAPSLLTLSARLGGKVRPLQAEAAPPGDAMRARTMVVATAPRLGDKRL